jgi:tRNA(fMet)-specific endonuclease VapC
MIIAATDVLIDFLRGADPVARRIELELQRGLATTVITAFELWAGAVGSPKRERAVETLLAALRLVPLDEKSAREAADIRQSRRTQGNTLGMADALIAGICVSERAILLTRNTKHFGDIEGLTVGTLPK